MILKLQVTSNKLTDIRFQINRRRKLKLRFSDRQLVGARNNGVKSCFMWRFLDIPIVHLHNVTFLDFRKSLECHFIIRPQVCYGSGDRLLYWCLLTLVDHTSPGGGLIVHLGSISGGAWFLNKRIVCD